MPISSTLHDPVTTLLAIRVISLKFLSYLIKVDCQIKNLSTSTNIRGMHFSRSNSLILKLNLQKLKLISSFLFISFIHHNAICQDSLFVKLSESQTDGEKYEILVQIISANIYANSELADSCSTMLLSLSKNMDNDSLQAKAFIGKITNKLVKAEYDSLDMYVDRVYHLIGRKKYIYLQSNILNLLALSHYYRGNYEKSLELNFENLNIREQIGRADFQITTLNNIGINYERLQENEKALKYYEMSLDLIPPEEKYHVAAAQNNIGAILLNLQKPTEARKVLQKANTTAKEIGHRLLILDTNLGLVETFMMLGEYQKARPLALEAVAIGEELDNKAKTISALNELAGICLKSGDFRSAAKNAERALEISYSHNIKEIRSAVYQNLSSAYEGLNRFRDAGEIKDSLLVIAKEAFNNEKISIAEELNIKYETAKKDVDLKTSQLQIEKQQYQKNIILLSSFLLSLLAGGLIYFLHNRIRVNKVFALQESQLKNQEIDNLEKQSRLRSMASMIEGQESERKRIAQDLHDGLGGLLAAIKMKFGIIQKQVDAPEPKNAFQETNKMITEACAEVRKIAHNMMPDALTKLGLVEAVRDISDYTLEPQIEVVDKGLHALSETEAIMLYRVIQEFINNSRKHANATQINVQFSADETHSIVNLQDDGQGFDLATVSNGTGLGLNSMKSRINYLGGNIEIDSTIDVGTTLQIQIPKP